MRGTKTAPKRSIAPDPKHRSLTLGKFVNYLMRHGKKSVALKILYTTLDTIAEQTKQDPIKVFDQAIKNASPLLEVRPRRIGGATYQVPMEVKPDRQRALAFRTIIAAARKRQGKPMAKFLAEEIVGAFNNEGEAIKRRDDMHKLAESNRAFAHYARF
ncbi:30S ribosomal protein S7 [Candidatus Berkelbacteria bacterium]|nr:30S ribosomal protein S7 [Candidatus Berkelbacteria bacterium]